MPERINYIKSFNDTARQNGDNLVLIAFDRHKHTVSMSDAAYSGLAMLAKRYTGYNGPADLLEAIGLHQLMLVYPDEISEAIPANLTLDQCRQVGFEDCMDGYDCTPEESTQPNLTVHHYDAYRLGYYEAAYLKLDKAPRLRRKSLHEKTIKTLPEIFGKK